MRTRDMWIFGAWCIAAASAGCASAGGRSPACALRDTDSTFAAHAPVYRECAVDTKAVLTTTAVQPDFRPTSPPTVACVFAEVEFVVDTAGKAEIGTARVARTNEQGFADAVIAMLPTLRYAHAVRAGLPVRQIVMERRTKSIYTGPTDILVPKGSGVPRDPRQERKAPC